MSPVYLNPQASSPIPFLELKGDQQHSFQVFGHVHDHDLATNSNNSSFSFNNSHNSYNSQEMLSFDYSRHGHAKVEKLVLSHEKASDLGQPCSSWLQSTVEDDSGYGFSFNLQGDQKIETVNYDEDQTNKNSRKWKPSKVRIMQKMMATSKNSGNNKQQLDHHDLAKQQRQNNDGIRVCSDCHTTTTPLWRSGPQGPKSLCNACGIRQRKARRAAMAAAAATGFGNDTIVTSTSPPVEARKPANKVQEIKPERGLLSNHDKSHTLPLKKRSKIIDAGSNNNNTTHNNSHNNAKKIGFEDLALSSNKDYLKPNPKRSFPRDEEEGAILLMALSCGLACSSY